jgi:adenylate cyclase
MSKEKELLAQLEQKQKELDLILAIDRIRDTVPEPTTMLSAIVNTLTEQFRAHLCMVCLQNRETGEMELRAVRERNRNFGHLNVTRELARRVLQTDEISIWKEDEVQEALGLEHVPEALQMAAVPIVMGQDEHLGALLLARARRPFDAGDVALLKTAESQIDSAVIQGYAYHDLQQRNRELETIYRVDHIRDQHLPFDDMLNSVLQELRAAIQAEAGFIMLYNQTGRKLELRAATDDDLFRVAGHWEVVNQAANEALLWGKLVFKSDLGQTLRSLMCVPLILREEIIGVLGVVNRYGLNGFDEGDRRLLSAIASQMDTAIFESIEQRRLRQVLGRSVDPRVMERLLTNPDVDFLKGERAVLTVLYADLRGSTSLAEHTEPELLVGFINDYLGHMTDVILSHEGTLDKFVGDEVMALFGAPFPLTDHALRAVQVGLDMQKAHHRVMAAWQARGLKPAPIGVGIATGELTVGEIGCSQRTDYTVIGRAANLGSRICSVAGAGEVLVSQATYDLIQDQVAATPVTGLRLKGVDQEVTAYHVTGVL